MTTAVTAPWPVTGTALRMRPGSRAGATCADRLGNPSTAIVDTRSDAEYYGDAVRAKRGGAIPGAVHLEWKQNLDKDGRYKSAAELRAMYEGLGVTPDREVVTYCQGGYRAAHTLCGAEAGGFRQRPELHWIVEGMGRSRRSAP